MRVQLTRDKQGFSVWSADTKIAYDGDEWSDTDCAQRGTNGIQDQDSIERMLGRCLDTGERVILEIVEVK